MRAFEYSLLCSGMAELRVPRESETKRGKIREVTPNPEMPRSSHMKPPRKEVWAPSPPPELLGPSPLSSFATPNVGPSSSYQQQRCFFIRGSLSKSIGGNDEVNTDEHKIPSYPQGNVSQGPTKENRRSPQPAVPLHREPSAAPSSAARQQLPTRVENSSPCSLARDNPTGRVFRCYRNQQRPRNESEMVS